jgi:hypothetical protein
MEYFNYQQNPDNRFKVIYYHPTLDMIKDELRVTHSQNLGYNWVLNEILSKDFQTDNLESIIEAPLGVFHILKRTKDYINSYLDLRCGLQNIETGELINRFYNGVFSYHPNQGYALLGQMRDRDYLNEGCNPTFRLVSLKSGKEFDEHFFDRKYTTAINDYKFYSCVDHTQYKGFDYFEIDPLSEELKGIENPNKDPHDWPDYKIANGRSREFSRYFNIEWVHFGQPFFETDVFKECLEKYPDLIGITPYDY